MSECTGRGFARQRLIALHDQLPNLPQDWLRSKVPVLIQLREKQRQIVLREHGGWCGVRCIPVLFFGGSRVERCQRHHGKLSGAERRVKALIDRIALPTAFRSLGGHHRFDGARQMFVGLRAPACLGQGQHRVIGDEIRRLGFLVKGIGPSAFGVS